MITTLQRRSRTLGFMAMAALVFTLGWLPGQAQAQIFKVCGDADGSGSVTVTDGVLVLRAAAGLSSDCTNELCDVDVNGTISVTDGVITLRKAAGLSIARNCIPDEGRIDPQVEHLVQRTQPLVSEALGTLVLRRDQVTDKTFNCENGEDGTLDVTIVDGQLGMSFSDCLVKNTLINGDADDAANDPILSSLSVTDVRSEESISFDGPLLGVDIDGGVKLSGNLDAVPDFTLFDTGDFLLVVNNLTIASTGTLLAGQLTMKLNADSNLPGVQRIRIVYDGSNLAPVLVTFDNGSVKSYGFDLNTRSFR
jgi:hypothetical protein